MVLAVVLAASLPTYSADVNETYKAAVGGFSYTPKIEKRHGGRVLDAIATGKMTEQQGQYANAVRASIISGLSNVVRFRVVEAGEDSGELHKFYVDGVISNISTTSKMEPNSEKGKPDLQYFKSLIAVTINLKDVLTGEVVDSRMFSISESDCSWVSSAEKAIDNSLKGLSSKVATHYNVMFPLTGSIIEAGEVKKDKQKQVYIDLGATFGVRKGLQFIVYSVKTIAGKEAKVEIGHLKIEKVLGDELSDCKVTKGDKQLKEALDNSETLIVVSQFGGVSQSGWQSLFF